MTMYSRKALGLSRIARKQLQLTQSLHQILQIVSVSAFEQTPLQELVMENTAETFPNQSPNQLMLNEIYWTRLNHTQSE